MASLSDDLETQGGYDISVTSRNAMNESGLFFLFISHGNIHIAHIIQDDEM
jgi:hypothetical protein